MTFSPAWITGHGLRRRERVRQRQRQGSEEFSWATEGKCVETDCFRQRLTDSFSSSFFFFDSSGLTHQIKLREKVSGFWSLSKSQAYNSFCGQMEVKSPVWVLPSDSLVLIPVYMSVLPGCLDLKICFPKISARSKPSMFPEQTEAHHQHLNIHEWIIKQAQQAQAQRASGTTKMSHFEVLFRKNANSSLEC